MTFSSPGSRAEKGVCSGRLARGGEGLSISVFGFANKDIKYLVGVLKIFLPNRPLTSSRVFFSEKSSQHRS